MEGGCCKRGRSLYQTVSLTDVGPYGIYGRLHDAPSVHALGSQTASQYAALQPVWTRDKRLYIERQRVLSSSVL